MMMGRAIQNTLVAVIFAAVSVSASAAQPYSPMTGYWTPQSGYPGYVDPRQRQKPQARSVRLEARFDTEKAYVYQNLVLTFDVISGENLATLKFTLPRSDAFVFKPLGSMTATARGEGSEREIVTTRQYMVIPLRDGTHTLDFSAEGSSASHANFNLKLQHPVQLEIKPPRPEVQPWLPLEELQLTAQLSDEENLKMGKPASLVLEISAMGTTGAQLPSLEKQLQSSDLRIYRENTENEGRLLENGKLFGKRVEHYTLLPGKESRLELPAIEIRWWNVVRARSEKTLLPRRNLGINATAADGSRKAN